MEERLTFERSSGKQLAVSILQHVLGEYGIKWRWSGSRDVVLPRNLPYLYRVVTYEMVKIGKSLDQLREVVFDRGMVKFVPLCALLDAMFYHRPCGGGFAKVIVACAIIGKLSVFCCRDGKSWLVDDLVEILRRVLSEWVGDNFSALERYASGKFSIMRIPEAA